jgi:hypothetical protein
MIELLVIECNRVVILANCWRAMIIQTTDSNV